MKTIVPTSKCFYNQFVVSNLHAFKANISHTMKLLYRVKTCVTYSMKLDCIKWNFVQCNPWNVQASIRVSYNWTIQVNGNVNQLFKSYFHSQNVIQLELLDVTKEKEKVEMTIQI
jgi:hypothetical protein